MGSGNERGPGNELEAQRAEQFPHLGNYTLTPVCQIIANWLLVSVANFLSHSYVLICGPKRGSVTDHLLLPVQDEEHTTSFLVLG